MKKRNTPKPNSKKQIRVKETNYNTYERSLSEELWYLHLTEIKCDIKELEIQEFMNQ